MHDISVEQIIKVKQPKTAIIFKVVAIIACIVAITTIPATYAWGIILFAAFALVTVFLFRYYNAEYEYTLVEAELTIDRIMSKSSRKKCGSYQMEKATLVTKVGSQDALRMEYKKLRSVRYTVDSENEGVVVIYTMDQHNEMVRIFIQPDQRMLEALKAVVSKEAYKIEA
jgi:hypothetical protein